MNTAEPLIIHSARKHGVADDDTLHAFSQPVRYRDLDDGFVLLIGPGRNAQLLKIEFVDSTDGPVIAHPTQARRRHLGDDHAPAACKRSSTTPTR